MKEKLKPCPFCGSEKVVSELTITDGSVKCRHCLAMITRIHIGPGDNGYQDAIKAWNTRA